MTKTKYYIYYVINCTPKLRAFKSKRALDNFISKFATNAEDGNWIDFTFKGQLLTKDEYYER